LNTRYRALSAAFLGFCIFLVGVARSAEELPAHLSDETFWKLVTEFSEGGGFFLSDNFVSNERLFQHVLSDLTHDRKEGGAYLGVGPEQNFTYVVALKPKIAFIFDIRRQNMIQHLMYKALFELSADRTQFLSRLFSRTVPPDLSKDATITELLDAFGGVSPDPQAYLANLAAIRNRLIHDHGFNLSVEDESSLDYVFSAFFIGGPGLTYSRTSLRGVMPTYEELMTESDQRGEQRSYLATEENFAIMRQLEMNNLIVPLVGDFAGPTAIRSVSDYLKDHNTGVTAFYTSNVEQYLFRTDDSWRKFYANVATLPLEAQSVFIRSMVKTRAGQYSPMPVIRPGYSYLENALYSIPDLVTAFDSEMIQSYYDVVYRPNNLDAVKD
jgi:hypothetical protein